CVTSRHVSRRGLAPSSTTLHLRPLAHVVHKRYQTLSKLNRNLHRPQILVHRPLEQDKWKHLLDRYHCASCSALCALLFHQPPFKVCVLVSRVSHARHSTSKFPLRWYHSHTHNVRVGFPTPWLAELRTQSSTIRLLHSSVYQYCQRNKRSFTNGQTCIRTPELKQILTNQTEEELEKRCAHLRTSSPTISSDW
ncbi:hypothetical protein P154DRAFT_458482, partial [Amniculicola lignicola CBS 123094]